MARRPTHENLSQRPRQPNQVTVILTDREFMGLKKFARYRGIPGLGTALREIAHETLVRSARR